VRNGLLRTADVDQSLAEVAGLNAALSAA